MNPPSLLHELVSGSAARTPDAIALVDGPQQTSYAALQEQIERCATGFRARGIRRGERIAIWLEKRIETVIACFAATRAGAAFVPVNPILKPAQVAHILRDCGVRMLVASRDRLATLETERTNCPELRHCIAIDSPDWSNLFTSAVPPAPTFTTEIDMAAIFYTSGSTGKPKGVVLSHRNLVAGAHSVAGYLDNRPDDVLLAALPLSFDAGFSQLTTAFHTGARIVLLNYLTPRDVLLAIQREGVTGLTAVPPLYIQLARIDWPAGSTNALRYFANTGGRMPLDTLARLREKMPLARPYLMYGLTEAFRATYLPPEEIDRRPDSIGKAIPNAEIFVLRPDGTPCAPDEPGELIQRGPLVAMGYWNNPQATAERFRTLPPGLRPTGLQLPETVVYSGDTVRSDAEGFLYFVGRSDEMIKTSGYRVSPTEIEEALYATGLIGECVACGVPHDTLGEAIHVVATTVLDREVTADQILSACRGILPPYMVPAVVDLRPGPLPRNANGKLDRAALRKERS
jgi:acyl-CoA ligase (AMP-forming) (exosortase A-associated)